MTGTVVVAAGSGGQPVDAAALARSVRALTDQGWGAVVVTPPGGAGLAGPLTLGLGASRAGRRAVAVEAHVLIDPVDPALAHPPGTAQPEPLAVLEAEAIAALLKTGFAVVVAGQTAVVPNDAPRGCGGVPHSDYRAVEAGLDGAACARRVAGDLGAGVLVFVTGDDGPPRAGDFDRREVEPTIDSDGPYAAEMATAVRFLGAGGGLAVFTTAAALPAALAPSGATGAGPDVLRIHRTLDRPRSDAPVLAAGWC
jgi:carbamate kinase